MRKLRRLIGSAFTGINTQSGWKRLLPSSHQAEEELFSLGAVRVINHQASSKTGFHGLGCYQLNLRTIFWVELKYRAASSAL